jgi:hypothetical protein
MPWIPNPRLLQRQRTASKPASQRFNDRPSTLSRKGDTEEERGVRAKGVYLSPESFVIGWFPFGAELYGAALRLILRGGCGPLVPALHEVYLFTGGDPLVGTKGIKGDTSLSNCMRLEIGGEMCLLFDQLIGRVRPLDQNARPPSLTSSVVRV